MAVVWLAIYRRKTWKNADWDHEYKAGGPFRRKTGLSALPEPRAQGLRILQPSTAGVRVGGKFFNEIHSDSVTNG